MKNECIEAVITELIKSNLPYRVEQTRKHTKIRYGPDYRHSHVVSTSPSDNRAHLNARALIKRILVQQGYGTNLGG